MSIIDWLLGRPLHSQEDRKERLGAIAGISIFGLDALGSASYGPEAALTVLMVLGPGAVQAILPITVCIVLLLLTVTASYLQTIAAYPSGGGSYTVTASNLGPNWGLLAGTALMIDYILTAAVGISAGVGAIASAVPRLQPWTLQLCLGILLILTLINLRGTRESQAIFAPPTFLFVGCMLAMLAYGCWKVFAAGGDPVPVAPPHPLGPARHAPTIWILLRGFSSGCTALTGIEAVSNGVSAFREPQCRTAQRCLGIIAGLLLVMLAGIAWLSKSYHVGATEPGRAGYESVLSQLTGAVAGKGVFYHATMVSVLLVLALQANTAFAGFPRLCQNIALDGYLPRAFANRGRKLVYTQGIVVLAVFAAALLFFSGGVTDHLIPLFAVGAFLAFTLSQTGMVWHWRRSGASLFKGSVLLNAAGATVTGATLVFVVISKFAAGAWLTLFFLPATVLFMRRIKRHHERVERELSTEDPLSAHDLSPPLVIVPIESWTRVSQRAIRFALSISSNVRVVHVRSDTAETPLEEHWEEWVGRPAKSSGQPAPSLVVLESPYRLVIKPIYDYILEAERDLSKGQIAVILPNLVERRWYQRFLHNQRAELLTAMLLLYGARRISIVNVPWYLRE
jgi:amino acid transporter